MGMSFSSPSVSTYGELTMRWGIGSPQKDYNPVMSFYDSYISFVTHLNKDCDLNVKFLAEDPESADGGYMNPRYIYLESANWKVGKQLVPFGSYTNYLITDTHTKVLEETVRLGVANELWFFNSLRLQSSLFNNAYGDAMTGGSLRFSIIPRNEFEFSVGALADQELNGANKDNRLDLNGNVKLDFKRAIITLEAYEGTTGLRKDALSINAGLKIILTPRVSLAFRYDYSSKEAASLTGALSGLPVGEGRIGSALVGLDFITGTDSDWKVELSGHSQQSTAPDYQSSYNLLTQYNVRF